MSVLRQPRWSRVIGAVAATTGFGVLSACADAPYEPIYAESAAQDSGPASDGFAADYDGVLWLTEVVELRAPGASDCL